MAKQIFKEKKIFRAISEILKLQPCERKDVLISELPITNRLRYRLGDCGCETVGEIITTGRDHFTKQRRVGVHTLRELDTLMNELALFHLYNNS